MIDRALDALSSAGVGFWVRKGPSSDRELPSGGEVDLGIPTTDRPAADEALRRAGFHRLAAPGHAPHTFYLAFNAGRWIKLDLKSTNRASPAEPGAGRVMRPARLERIWRGIQMRGPAGLPRRLGPTVAFIGPDGAGKGTVIQALRGRIPVAVRVVPMGGRPRRGRARRARERMGPRTGGMLEVAMVLTGFGRTWRRLVGAYAAAWKGEIVLFDRHPMEVLAIRPPRAPLAASLERFLLGRLVPRPDAVIVLDAPADVLFERKGEHPSTTLDRWRQAYRAEFIGPATLVLSTMGEVERTVDAASGAVWEALSARRRWSR